jgi:hypothetical protein
MELEAARTVFAQLGHAHVDDVVAGDPLHHDRRHRQAAPYRDRSNRLLPTSSTSDLAHRAAAAVRGSKHAPSTNSIDHTSHRRCCPLANATPR